MHIATRNDRSERLGASHEGPCGEMPQQTPPEVAAPPHQAVLLPDRSLRRQLSATMAVLSFPPGLS